MSHDREGPMSHDHRPDPPFSRRALLLAPAAFLGQARPAAAQDRARFARRALELRREAEARGDQPYGAVVVKDGVIVGEGVSAVVARRDPTAHAEMEAIREAARRLGRADLSGAELYGSSRPCFMCEAAAYWARVARMYAGESAQDEGPPRYRSC